MSFSYRPELTEPLDQLRFLIEDTDSSVPFFQDEELEWMIEEWMPRFDSIYYVAAQAADKLAVKFASMPSVSADGVSVDLSGMARQFRELAAQLRQTYKDAQVGGQIDLSNIMVGTRRDPSIRPLRFSVGLHDNPEVGNQDYGTLTYDPWGGDGYGTDDGWGSM